jgi:hypothetical protein
MTSKRCPSFQVDLLTKQFQFYLMVVTFSRLVRPSIPPADAGSKLMSTRSVQFGGCLFVDYWNVPPNFGRQI